MNFKIYLKLEELKGDLSMEMQLVKVNYFLPGAADNFRVGSRKVEDALAVLGRIVSTSVGGAIAQFVVHTQQTVDEVRVALATICHGGTVHVGEFIEDEEPAADDD